jgi:protein required for attachment to host cells
MRTKKIKTWVVLADGARARILANEGPGTGLVEVEEWVSAEARKPTRDLGTERPGRGHESATQGRHAITPRADWHDAAEAEFARDLAHYLKTHVDTGAFDQLVLAAPPRALGVLRQVIDPATAGLVKSEINKDLTKIPLADLGSHLDEVIRI